VTCAQSIEATEVRLKAKEKELVVLETDLRGRANAAQQDLEESEKRLAEAEAVVRKGGADIDRRSAEVDALKAKVERQEQVSLFSLNPKH
jgi:multidrug resistance efflux pump